MMKAQGFRWLYTSGGKLVLAGKNAEQNEQIVGNAEAEDILLHTKDPGSPFCMIGKGASDKDIKEAAAFCACFSQGWKKRKKEMEVHIFSGSQMVKDKKMKTGTFGVLGRVRKLKVRLELWLGEQKGKLRAAPKSCLGKPLAKIVPGKVGKDAAADFFGKILEKKFGIGKSFEEIAQALPAGGFSC